METFFKFFISLFVGGFASVGIFVASQNMAGCNVTAYCQSSINDLFVFGGIGVVIAILTYGFIAVMND